MTVTRPGRVVVIGAGPAGLMAGLTAARAGADVRVLTKGRGSLYWGAGCVDVLDPGPDQEVGPGEAVRRLIETRPDHPYSIAGVDAVEEGVDDIARTAAAAGYALAGSLDATLPILTGVGGVRRTCLAPRTMAAGSAENAAPTLIVGFDAFADLTPSLVSDNLEARGIPCRPVSLDPPSLGSRRFVNAAVLAAAFERPEFRSEVVSLLQPKVGRAARIGFPAVLGIGRVSEVAAALRDQLGADIFELPIVPPSIPGMRLHRILTAAIRDAGGRVDDGMEALDLVAEDGRIVGVETESAGRTHRTRGDAFVLATGGILGGGIVGDQTGALREVVAGLEVTGPHERKAWVSRDFDAPEGHPVFRSGISVDRELRPLDGGVPSQDNLFVAGSLIAGADAVRERSVDGIAYTTGRVAGANAARQALDGGTPS